MTVAEYVIGVQCEYIIVLEGTQPSCCKVKQLDHFYACVNYTFLKKIFFVTVLHVVTKSSNIIIV